MRFVVTFIIVFIMSGCGILESSRTSSYVKEQRSKNLDPYHIHSCGPEAIQKALLRLNIKTSLENLSHAMQSSPSCGNFVREVVSVFFIEGRRITLPSEMKSAFEKHGFKITNVKNLKELNKNKDTAVVLIKRKNSLNYHWMCFPIDEDIETFFGKETLIKEIYLIRK